MNAIRFYCSARFRLLGLLLVLLAGPNAALAAVDATFPLLETKTGTYSNVTVTTKAADYIVIQHARGLTSIKVAELTPMTLKDLGYVLPENEATSTATAAAKATALVNSLPTRDIEEAWSKYAPAGTPPVKLNAGILLGMLGVLVVLYLLFCYCASLICQKVGKPAGFLVWVPVLQYIPLFRAADMSPAWLLAMLVPGLNVVAQIIWSFKIARARGKGLLTAILLLLPTYPFAFMYLAFAPATRVEDKTPGKKFTPTSLTFDTA